MVLKRIYGVKGLREKLAKPDSRGRLAVKPACVSVGVHGLIIAPSTVPL